MRNQKTTTTIALDIDVYSRLAQDKEHFQEIIGGGIWSMSDAVREYQRILNTLKPQKKQDLDDDDKILQ